MRYEAAPTHPHPRPHRRLILAALLSAAATIPSGRELPPRPPTHIPEIYLESLRQRVPGAERDAEYEFSAAYYLAAENEKGANIAGAILELQGVNPDVAQAQIEMLLARAGEGAALSREERRAIVVLTNWWPDEYAPYYGADGNTRDRITLVNNLKSRYPALRNSFQEWQRHENGDEVASRER